MGEGGGEGGKEGRRREGGREGGGREKGRNVNTSCVRRDDVQTPSPADPVRRCHAHVPVLQAVSSQVPLT